MEFQESKMEHFQDQCIKEITPNLFHEADDKMAIFSSTLPDIAADNIPKTSPFPKKKPNLGLIKIAKQLRRNEINLID